MLNTANQSDAPNGRRPSQAALTSLRSKMKFEKMCTGGVFNHEQCTTSSSAEVTASNLASHLSVCEPNQGTGLLKQKPQPHQQHQPQHAPGRQPQQPSHTPQPSQPPMYHQQQTSRGPAPAPNHNAQHTLVVSGGGGALHNHNQQGHQQQHTHNPSNRLKQQLQQMQQHEQQMHGSPPQRVQGRHQQHMQQPQAQPLQQGRQGWDAPQYSQHMDSTNIVPPQPRHTQQAKPNNFSHKAKPISNGSQQQQQQQQQQQPMCPQVALQSHSFTPPVPPTYSSPPTGYHKHNHNSTPQALASPLKHATPNMSYRGPQPPKTHTPPPSLTVQPPPATATPLQPAGRGGNPPTYSTPNDLSHPNQGPPWTSPPRQGGNGNNHLNANLPSPHLMPQFWLNQDQPPTIQSPQRVRLAVDPHNLQPPVATQQHPNDSHAHLHNPQQLQQPSSQTMRGGMKNRNTRSGSIPREVHHPTATSPQVRWQDQVEAEKRQKEKINQVNIRNGEVIEKPVQTSHSDIVAYAAAVGVFEERGEVGNAALQWLEKRKGKQPQKEDVSATEKQLAHSREIIKRLAEERDWLRKEHQKAQQMLRMQHPNGKEEDEEWLKEDENELRKSRRKFAQEILEAVERDDFSPTSSSQECASVEVTAGGGSQRSSVGSLGSVKDVSVHEVVINVPTPVPSEYSRSSASQKSVNGKDGSRPRSHSHSSTGSNSSRRGSSVSDSSTNKSVKPSTGKSSPSGGRSSPFPFGVQPTGPARTRRSNSVSSTSSARDSPRGNGQPSKQLSQSHHRPSALKQSTTISVPTKQHPPSSPDSTVKSLCQDFAESVGSSFQYSPLSSTQWPDSTEPNRSSNSSPTSAEPQRVRIHDGPADVRAFSSSSPPASVHSESTSGKADPECSDSEAKREKKQITKTSMKKERRDKDILSHKQPSANNEQKQTTSQHKHSPTPNQTSATPINSTSGSSLATGTTAQTANSRKDNDSVLSSTEGEAKRRERERAEKARERTAEREKPQRSINSSKLNSPVASPVTSTHSASTMSSTRPSLAALVAAAVEEKSQSGNNSVTVSLASLEAESGSPVIRLHSPSTTTTVKVTESDVPPPLVDTAAETIKVKTSVNIQPIRVQEASSVHTPNNSQASNSSATSDDRTVPKEPQSAPKSDKQTVTSKTKKRSSTPTSQSETETQGGSGGTPTNPPNPQSKPTHRVNAPVIASPVASETASNGPPTNCTSPIVYKQAGEQQKPTPKSECKEKKMAVFLEKPLNKSNNSIIDSLTQNQAEALVERPRQQAQKQVAMLQRGRDRTERTPNVALLSAAEQAAKVAEQLQLKQQQSAVQQSKQSPRSLTPAPSSPAEQQQAQQTPQISPSTSSPKPLQLQQSMAATSSPKGQQQKQPASTGSPTTQQLQSVVAAAMATLPAHLQQPVKAQSGLHQTAVSQLPNIQSQPRERDSGSSRSTTLEVQQQQHVPQQQLHQVHRQLQSYQQIVVQRPRVPTPTLDPIEERPTSTSTSKIPQLPYPSSTQQQQQRAHRQLVEAVNRHSSTSICDTVDTPLKSSTEQQRIATKACRGRTPGKSEVTCYRSATPTENTCVKLPTPTRDPRAPGGVTRHPSNESLAASVGRHSTPTRDLLVNSKHNTPPNRDFGGGNRSRSTTPLGPTHPSHSPNLLLKHPEEGPTPDGQNPEVQQLQDNFTDMLSKEMSKEYRLKVRAPPAGAVQQAKRILSNDDTPTADSRRRHSTGSCGGSEFNKTLKNCGSPQNPIPIPDPRNAFLHRTQHNNTPTASVSPTVPRKHQPTPTKHGDDPLEPTRNSPALTTTLPQFGSDKSRSVDKGGAGKEKEGPLTSIWNRSPSPPMLTGTRREARVAASSKESCASVDRSSASTPRVVWVQSPNLESTVLKSPTATHPIASSLHTYANNLWSPTTTELPTSNRYLWGRATTSPAESDGIQLEIKEVNSDTDNATAKKLLSSPSSPTSEATWREFVQQLQQQRPTSFNSGNKTSTPPLSTARPPVLGLSPSPLNLPSATSPPHFSHSTHRPNGYEMPPRAKSPPIGSSPRSPTKSLRGNTPTTFGRQRPVDAQQAVVVGPSTSISVGDEDIVALMALREQHATTNLVIRPSTDIGTRGMLSRDNTTNHNQNTTTLTRYQHTYEGGLPTAPPPTRHPVSPNINRRQLSPPQALKPPTTGNVIGNNHSNGMATESNPPVPSITSRVHTRLASRLDSSNGIPNSNIHNNKVSNIAMPSNNHVHGPSHLDTATDVETDASLNVLAAQAQFHVKMAQAANHPPTIVNTVRGVPLYPTTVNRRSPSPASGPYGSEGSNLTGTSCANHTLQSASPQSNLHYSMYNKAITHTIDLTVTDTTDDNLDSSTRPPPWLNAKPSMMTPLGSPLTNPRWAISTSPNNQKVVHTIDLTLDSTTEDDDLVVTRSVGGPFGIHTTQRTSVGSITRPHPQLLMGSGPHPVESEEPEDTISRRHRNKKNIRTRLANGRGGVGCRSRTISRAGTPRRRTRSAPPVLDNRGVLIATNAGIQYEDEDMIIMNHPMGMQQSNSDSMVSGSARYHTDYLVPSPSFATQQQRSTQNNKSTKYLSHTWLPMTATTVRVRDESDTTTSTAFNAHNTAAPYGFSKNNIGGNMALAYSAARQCTTTIGQGTIASRSGKSETEEEQGPRRVLKPLN